MTSVVGRNVVGRNLPGYNVVVKGDYDEFGSGLILPKSPINIVRPSQHKFSDKIIY